MLTFPHITNLPSARPCTFKVGSCWELSFPVEPAGGLGELVRLRGGSSRRRNQRTTGDNVISTVIGKSDNLRVQPEFVGPNFK